MTARLRPLLSLALAAAGVAGCTPRADFPSLAIRPAELDDSALEEPVRAQPVTASDPALKRQIDSLLSRARAGAADFDAAYGPAQAAIGSAGPSGSDSWIAAQQALSRLEAAGLESADVLAELNELATAHADTPTAREDYRAIETAIRTVEDAQAPRRERLESLRAQLGN